MATAKKAAAKRRATAARQAYKSVVSPTGVKYSPRSYVKGDFGTNRANRVGKQIANSAAKKGKSANTMSIGGRKATVTKPNAINFTKLTKALSVHSSMGEIQGVEKAIRQAYRKNLRQAKRRAR